MGACGGSDRTRDGHVRTWAVPDRDQPVPERAAGQRPPPRTSAEDVFRTMSQTRRGEPLWLGALPDVLPRSPDAARPEARTRPRRAIALAFVTACSI